MSILYILVVLYTLHIYNTVCTTHASHALERWHALIEGHQGSLHQHPPSARLPQQHDTTCPFDHATHTMLAEPFVSKGTGLWERNRPWQRLAGPHRAWLRRTRSLALLVAAEQHIRVLLLGACSRRCTGVHRCVSQVGEAGPLAVGGGGGDGPSTGALWKKKGAFAV